MLRRVVTDCKAICREVRRRLAVEEQFPKHRSAGDRDDRCVRGGCRDREELQRRAGAEPNSIYAKGRQRLPCDRSAAWLDLSQVSHWGGRVDRGGENRAADLAKPRPN